MMTPRSFLLAQRQCQTQYQHQRTPSAPSTSNHNTALSIPTPSLSPALTPHSLPFSLPFTLVFVLVLFHSFTYFAYSSIFALLFLLCKLLLHRRLVYSISTILFGDWHNRNHDADHIHPPALVAQV
ncbi:hypothetical protein NW754_005409 [Fusarium falciforme]|nr:hypothetical protein NW754_005409 [Fusarium falciforme]